MSKATSASERMEALGEMPQWNLNDLYEGSDSAQYKQDLAACSTRSKAFEARFKGTLAQHLENSPGEIAQAVAEYEAIQEIMGRIMSHASLAYAGNTSDLGLAKAFGDAQEKITAASSHLLFFELELNRLDDSKLDAAMGANAALGHYRPWLEDLRKDKPYQLEDRVEQLFHDKSVVGRSAWNRLFDETMAALRFDIGGEKLSLEPALNLLQDTDRAKREEAAREISRVLAENGRLFTLITNTLAKDKQISDQWRGFQDVADARHLSNRVEREVVDALAKAVEDAFPRISHRYYALKAKWLGLDKMQYWDRNAPLPKSVERIYPWDEARGHRARRLFAVCTVHGRNRRTLLRPELDRRSGAAGQVAGGLCPSRRCRASTPMSCSTTWASRAT